jgi:hypothetical protein
MSDVPKDPVDLALRADNLEDVDREIARLAVLCQARVLEPGVIERVLKNDASVCGTANPVAFRKLHDLLMLHLAMRERSVESFGQAPTIAIEDYVIERLRKSFPDLPGGWRWPPV